MKRMRLAIYFLLALVCMLALAICGTPVPNGPPADLDKLTTALDFIDDAESYQITAGPSNYLSEKYYEQFTRQVMIDETGTQTLLLKEGKKGETGTYLRGTEGYFYHGVNDYGMMIKMDGFTIEDLEPEDYRWNIGIMKNVLRVVRDMNPTGWQKDDGSIYILSTNTNEQFKRIESTFSPDYIVANVRYDKIGNPKLRITIELDENDRLRSFKYERRFSSALIWVGEIFTVDMINQIEHFEQPDWFDDAQLRPGADLILIENGRHAVYHCRKDYYGKWQLSFHGIDSEKGESFFVDLYIVPDYLKGIPVTYITRVSANTLSDVKIGKLVIPAGATILTSSSETARTEFYLHDSGRNMANNALEVGLTAKAIYYANQWEMVDGVPVAK